MPLHPFSELFDLDTIISLFITVTFNRLNIQSTPISAISSRTNLNTLNLSHEYSFKFT